MPQSRSRSWAAAQTDRSGTWRPVGPDEPVEHAVVVVAEDLGVVGAVEVVVRVRRARLRAAEEMHELVRLDGGVDAAPAAAIDARDHARLPVPVVRVVLGRPVVRLHRGDAAEHVGVHPDEVLAVRAVEPLRRQLCGRAAEACDPGRRERHLRHVERAVRAGHEADVPHAAGLGRAVVERRVDDAGPEPDEGRDLVVAVGPVRRVGVDGLDAVAGDAVPDAPDGSRAAVVPTGRGRRRGRELGRGRAAANVPPRGAASGPCVQPSRPRGRRSSKAVLQGPPSCARTRPW